MATYWTWCSLRRVKHLCSPLSAAARLRGDCPTDRVKGNHVPTATVSTYKNTMVTIAINLLTLFSSSADDNFEGYGNKFFLALFGNFQPQTSFARIGKVRLSVSPVTEEESSFTVERQGKETKYTAPTEVEYKSEDVNLDSIKTRDQSKPIAFISGHECGTVPFNIFYCDQLVEQLPPSATWGKRFISAPIEGRSAVDVFRVVASRDNTILGSSCFQGNNINLTLNAGEFREFNMSSSSYCYYESNEPLLMVQFSVASDLDNVLAGDPFMVVVPPVEQYRNSYNISTFVSSDETNPGTNYSNINILFPASESGSPQDILFDGQPLSSSVQFVEIP